MSAKRIITVFGATGKQGGAIVKTFLNDPELNSTWTVRAVTRDVSKDSAKTLASQGAEVVAADLTDKATLAKALEGSDTVYAVTNYWEKLDMALEEQQGRNIADAAKETGVKHLIWSSLLDVAKLSNGKYTHLYHFDSKAHVEEYVRELGIPATFFMPGFYMPNIPGQMLSKRGENWVFSLPIASTSPIPLYNPADTGNYVKAIVNNKEALLGKRFLGATEYLTAQGVVDTFKKVFPEDGRSAMYYETPKEGYFGFMKSTGMPDFVVEELYENMVLMQDFGYYGGEPLDESLGFVKDKLTTWAEYTKEAPAFAGLK
ncbi:NMRAL1 protein [Xylaria bambusicola]|uniref:NMRAL1 protein n=1 Tax=Xylaria bambusicola TaxID=326684 RepID=UPI0020076B5C|nr:NMRAL1 protein [Xylaria bambusicola]KAI0506944.1 NMRAL1 protein [Xylaria bambusicola]